MKTVFKRTPFFYAFFKFLKEPIIPNNINAKRFATITAGPICKFKIQAAKNPIMKDNIETKRDVKTTDLKLLQIRIAVKVGNIITPEIKTAPIILIPTTIVIAVKRDIITLYNSALIPVAFAKFSSNVMAKILL